MTTLLQTTLGIFLILAPTSLFSSTFCRSQLSSHSQFPTKSSFETAEVGSNISTQEIAITPQSLLEAHEFGYFYDRAGWTKPIERGVYKLKEMRLSERLQRAVREAKQKNVRVRFNSAFDRVVDGCREMQRAAGNTEWLIPEVAEGYKALYTQNKMYSIEVWSDSGELLAGIFGIIVKGRAEGISMFRNQATKKSDGMGFVALAAELLYFAQQGVQIFDTEVLKTGSYKTEVGASPMGWKEFDAFFEANSQEPAIPPASSESNIFRVFDEMQSRNDFRLYSEWLTQIERLKKP